MTPPEPLQGVSGFIVHLVELRSRLIRSCMAILIAFVCLAPFASNIFDVVALPLLGALPHDSRMIATGVITPFLIPLKISLLLAFLIALPYVLHQAWSFIVPALYDREKKLIAPLLVSSFLLFLLGMAFCYFVVFGAVFRTIYEFAPQAISVTPDIENYYNFIITMFLAFGMTFEVPIVVVVLARTELVTLQKLREIRRYVIVGAFFVSAIFTPPDVMSQLLLAIPLCLLYEVGLLITPLFLRHSEPSWNQ